MTLPTAAPDVEERLEVLEAIAGELRAAREVPRHLLEHLAAQ